MTRVCKEMVLQGGSVLRYGKSELEKLDLHIGSDGRIRTIAPEVRADNIETLAVDGWLVLPGLIDVHQHLDKSRTRGLISNVGGALESAIEAYRTIAPTISARDMVDRATETIVECGSYGTASIRSHTNIDPEVELRALQAMVEVREQNKDRMHVELVAHLTGAAC